MDKIPLYSKRVSAGSRVYYMDVHTDSKGQKYLAISEIPKDTSPGKKQRQRIFVHADKLDEFGATLAGIISYIKNDA